MNVEVMAAVAGRRDAAGMAECLREIDVTVGIDPFDSTEIGESAAHWETTIVRSGDSAQQQTTYRERSPSPMAPGLEPGLVRPDGTERLASRRVPFARACDMAVRGEITDSITIVALFRLMARRSARRQR